MTPATPLPGDQSHDGLLDQTDLPPGWYLPRRFPGERDDDASGEIDRVLGYYDQVTTNDQQQAQLESEQNETMDGRWRYIDHESTRTRVLIRLQRAPYVVPDEVRITGVIYLPWQPGAPITSQHLRELPTARIEAAINKRLFAINRVRTITKGKVELPSGRKINERELLKPLSDPKQTPDFYDLVALQHGRLTSQGDTNPSATMAEINSVALSTAQGWITKARTRGLLPPGRRGRAG
jgi:hypothetical protein